MRRLIPLIIIIFLLSGVVAFAQTNDTGDVGVSAEVIPWGGSGHIEPPVPIVVIKPTPQYPDVEKSLIVNNNEKYTNSLEVVLSIFAEKAFQMTISNSNDFAGTSWEPYQISKNWNLIPGDGKKTVYIKFRSEQGGVSEVVSDSIILDTTPPVNASDFNAVSGNGQISLSWLNPIDFKAVRITRSTEFYLSDPLSGDLVYDNKGNFLNDFNLINGTRYYYTAFTYDEAGNYASGVIASGVPQGVIPSEIPPEFPPEVPPELIPSEIETLSLKDFDFIQNNKTLLIEDGKIKIDSKNPLLISIDYEKVPEVLKTLMITLEKDGKTFSFLQRVNLDKTAYTATIAPPESALYPLTITILDYKNQTLKKISGEIEVEEETVPFSIYTYLTYIYILIIILILALVAYTIRKLYSKEEE